MNREQINGLSGYLEMGLSVLALGCVGSGYFQPPKPDEGAAAHIFQLAIVALVPTILLYVFTADWKQPLRSARALAVSGVTLAAAFAALYYLEHFR